MTTPSGYPDYARLSVQAGAILAQIFGVNVNTNPHTPAINMTGYGFVNVGMNDLTITAHLWVQLAWYTDQTLLNQVASSGMTIPPGSQDVRQFPVLSPWLQVTILYLSGPTTDQPNLTVYGTNQEIPLTGSEMVGQPMGVVDQSVAASGGTATLTTTTVAPPKVSIGIWHSTNGLWVADLYYFDRVANAFSRFFEFDGATFNNNALANIGVPPTYLQLILTNKDTVARTMVAFITAFA